MALPTVTIEGNVTKDPELRFTPAGDPVCSFTVVGNKRKRQPDGTWVDDKATFMDVTCWRQLAENVAETVTQGTQVLVVGELQQRQYEDREGKTRSAYQVVATNVGVALRFATAEVKKVERTGAKPKPQQSEDPWGLNQSDQPPW
jgi:single-strand DNA-binding protein